MDPLRQRILIVEDDPNVALVLQDALSEEGYETEHAANAFDLTPLSVGLHELPARIQALFRRTQILVEYRRAASRWN